MTVLTWLERFPDAMLREGAPLLLPQAWVLSLSARREATGAIAALEYMKKLDEGPLPD